MHTSSSFAASYIELRKYAMMLSATSFHLVHLVRGNAITAGLMDNRPHTTGEDLPEHMQVYSQGGTS